MQETFPARPRSRLYADTDVAGQGPIPDGRDSLFAPAPGRTPASAPPPVHLRFEEPTGKRCCPRSRPASPARSPRRAPGAGFLRPRPRRPTPTRRRWRSLAEALGESTAALEERVEVEPDLLGAAAYDLPVEANSWVEAELDFLVEQRAP